MARAYGISAKLAGHFETVYGTAPTTGFRALSFVSSTLGAAQPLIEDDRIGTGRDPLAPVLDAVTVDGDVVIPLEVESIGWWLKALLGAGTPTTANGVTTHVYHSGAATLPSMALEVGLPEVPLFRTYAGVRANTFQLRMQRSGQVTATVGLMGQSESTPATTTQVGSPTAYAATRFGAFQGSIQRDAVALGEVVSVDMTYSNGLEMVETIRSDGQVGGIDPTRSSLTGQIVMRLASTTLIDQAVAGTACALKFGYSAGASASLNIEAHAAYLSRPRVGIEGPQGVQVTFDFQCAKASNPARMATVTLVNGVASY